METKLDNILLIFFAIFSNKTQNLFNVEKNSKNYKNNNNDIDFGSFEGHHQSKNTKRKTNILHIKYFAFLTIDVFLLVWFKLSIASVFLEILFLLMLSFIVSLTARKSEKNVNSIFTQVNVIN